MLGFDLRTVVVLLAAVSVLQAAILVLFSRLVARRYQGLGLWALSSATNAAGFVLLVLRGVVPDLWSIVVANVALVAALALNLAGANRFLERARPSQERLAWALVAIAAALLVPLTYLAPSVAARTAVVSGALGALALLCASSLLRAPLPHLLAARRFTAALLTLSGLAHLLRAGLAVAGDPVPDVFSPTLVQTLSFLLSLAVLLLWLAGVVALTFQRLLHDVRVAQEASRAALEQSAHDAERRAEEARELLDALTAANRIVREREQLFRLTFDRSPLGAALIAPDGQFLRVNEALSAIIGYAEGELLRRDVFAILLPDERGAAGAQGRALIGGAERVSLEVQATRADGTLIWLQVTAGLVRDEAGVPLHILALIEDITGRKQIDQRLRTVEHQRALILRTMPDPFWFKDTEGRYVLWSDAFLAFHNVTAEQVAGRRAREVFPPELAEGMEESDERVVATSAPFRRELRAIDPHTGGERWTDTSKRLIYDGGVAIGTIGITRDITARKEAETALRRSNERLELALWGAELGLWDWHIPSGTIETNAQLAHLLGLSQAELFPVVKVWNEHTHPDDLAANVAAFEAAIEGRSESIDIEFRVRHADGGWRWQAARGRAVERDERGRAVRLIGVTRDITARRTAQQELEAREALLRSVSDNLPGGLIYQLERTRDGARRYRYLSAGVGQLWGVDAETAYADPEALWSRIHPDDRPGYEAAARAAREAMRLFEYEMRVCLPGGRTRWAFCRSTPEVLPDGRILHSGVELDITARKQAEAALQRRVHELTVLYQITHALTTWTNLADSLAPVRALLREVFAARAITIWDYDSAGRCLRALPGSPDAAPARPLRLAELQLRASVLDRPAVSVLTLPPGHPLCGDSAATDAGGLHVLLAPLRARQTSVGLLCISPAAPGHVYTPEDVALAQTVAGVLASALDNAHLFAQARSTAAERERRRLARELHDSVSQALFAASRIAETLPLLWELDPDEGREALGKLHRFTTGALAEMRALLVELRPPALVEAPLHETLTVLAPTARARGVDDVQTRLASAPLLPPDVQVALYRIAQEALNNVIKHARAQRVAMTLTLTPSYLPDEPWEGTATLSVVDNGRGFTLGPGSGEQFGLSTMRERAAEIGAALEIDSVPGGGTRVSVSWQGAAYQPAGSDTLVQ